jgi:hypothetical protein
LKDSALAIRPFEHVHAGWNAIGLGVEVVKVSICFGPESTVGKRMYEQADARLRPDGMTFRRERSPGVDGPEASPARRRRIA